MELLDVLLAGVTIIVPVEEVEVPGDPPNEKLDDPVSIMDDNDDAAVDDDCDSSGRGCICCMDACCWNVSPPLPP